MIVREKYAQIEIQRTLKKQDFGFCKKVIYTPYEYRESIESKKKYKNLSETQKHAKRNRNSKKYFRSRTPRRRKFIRESISYIKRDINLNLISLENLLIQNALVSFVVIQSTLQISVLKNFLMRTLT